MRAICSLIYGGRHYELSAAVSRTQCRPRFTATVCGWKENAWAYPSSEI